MPTQTSLAVDEMRRYVLRSGVVVAVAVVAAVAVLVMAVVRVVVVDGWCRVLQNSLVALEELRHFLVT